MKKYLLAVAMVVLSLSLGCFADEKVLQCKMLGSSSNGGGYILQVEGMQLALHDIIRVEREGVVLGEAPVNSLNPDGTVTIVPKFMRQIWSTDKFIFVRHTDMSFTVEPEHHPVYEVQSKEPPAPVAQRGPTNSGRVREVKFRVTGTASVVNIEWRMSSGVPQTLKNVTLPWEASQYIKPGEFAEIRVTGTDAHSMGAFNVLLMLDDQQWVSRNSGALTAKPSVSVNEVVPQVGMAPYRGNPQTMQPGQ